MIELAPSAQYSFDQVAYEHECQYTDEMEPGNVLPATELIGAFGNLVRG